MLLPPAVTVGICVFAKVTFRAAELDCLHFINACRTVIGALSPTRATVCSAPLCTFYPLGVERLCSSPASNPVHLPKRNILLSFREN